MDALNGQIDSISKGKREVDYKIGALNDEMKALSLQSTSKAKLGVKMTDKKSKESKLTHMYACTAGVPTSRWECTLLQLTSLD